jgi:hypothetical protein
MVYVNLTTLGLDSILPQGSKDYVVASIKLVQSTRDRDEQLKKIDCAIEVLRTLISSYNSANATVELSSSLFASVKARYETTPTIADFMNSLVADLISKETPL